MKKLLILLASLFSFSSVFLMASNIARDGYGGSPVSILDAVVKEANKDYKIQDTLLDGVTSTAKSVGTPQYRLTNTLAYLKDTIHPYLQRVLFVGLTIATILLIYNGFLMVTNITHGGGEFSKLKTNLINIGIGVIVLTGFYFLIDIILAVLNLIFD